MRPRTGAGAKADTGETPAGLGQRERNKIDKLRRIKQATRSLFASKGFDDTTIREIAARAGVGLGTVFVYAENKRDLLFLVANDGLEQAAEAAKGAVDPDASLLDNLVAVFRPQYAFFARQPALSRLVLREMMFYASGAQAHGFQRIREELIELVDGIVGRALADETIRSGEKPAFIGWTIFCIYQVELRHWIADDAPDLEAGLKRLGRAIKLCVTGLNPTRAALRRRSRSADPA